MVIRARVGQEFRQDPADRSVKLTVGGSALVYEGTKIKIRCPVKKKFVER